MKQRENRDGELLATREKIITPGLRAYDSAIEEKWERRATTVNSFGHESYIPPAVNLDQLLQISRTRSGANSGHGTVLLRQPILCDKIDVFLQPFRF